MADLSKYSDADLKSLYLQSLTDTELQQMHGQLPEDSNDAIKSYGGGMERGAAATAMALPNLLNEAVAGPQELYRGIRDTIQDNPTDNSPMWQPFYSSSEALKMLPESLQPHEATTTGGKIADFAGQMMGGVLAGTSPKSVIMNANKDSEAVRLAKILTDKNIPVYLNDVLPEGSAYKSASELLGDLPFAGKSSRVAAQQEGLNSALAKEMGMDSKAITPPVMSRAADEAGDVFKFIGDNYNISKPQTSQLLNDLSVMQGKFNGLDPKSANPLNYHINDILDKVGNTGELSGTAYSQVRSDLGRLARSTTDPQVEIGAYSIQKKLDNAMAPSIPKDMQSIFSGNRQYYRNMIALEPAAKKSIGTGNINPTALEQGVSKVYPNYIYDDAASMPQLTQGAQLLNAKGGNLAATTPMQNFVRQYGWGGDTAQLALLGGSPVLGPMARLMNPKLLPKDFSEFSNWKGEGGDISKALGRALMSLPASTISQGNSPAAKK